MLAILASGLMPVNEKGFTLYPAIPNHSAAQSALQLLLRDGGSPTAQANPSTLNGPIVTYSHFHDA